MQERKESQNLYMCELLNEKEEIVDEYNSIKYSFETQMSELKEMRDESEKEIADNKQKEIELNELFEITFGTSFSTNQILILP